MKKNNLPRLDVSKIPMGVHRPPEDFAPEDESPDEWDSPEYIDAMKRGWAKVKDYCGPLEKAFAATGMDTPLLDRVVEIESALNAEFKKDPHPNSDRRPTDKQAQIIYILRFIDELKNDLFGALLREKPDYEERTVSNALNIGAMLMRLAIAEQLPEMFRMLNRQDRQIAELPRKTAGEVKKRRPTGNPPGRRPCLTPAKTDKACSRLRRLIEVQKMKQLEAATQVIDEMKLPIGPQYLLQLYRPWLPRRKGKNT